MTAETYVNQIVRKVKCSRKKRGEIRRQLLAEVSVAMEQGASLDKVMLQMGEPIAIAEEFNENLSGGERKKYRHAVAAKVTASIVTVVAVLVLAVVWFLPRGAEIGSSGLYAEAALEEQAKAVIQMLNAEDYGALAECSNRKMKTFVTKEMLDGAKEQVGTDWGEFQKFGKCYMQELKQQGKIYAVVQIYAAYENVGVTYTLSFDENMELAGFYMK